MGDMLGDILMTILARLAHDITAVGNLEIPVLHIPLGYIIVGGYASVVVIFVVHDHVLPRYRETR